MIRSSLAPASLLMALALAACSGSTDAPASTSPPATPAPTMTAEPAPAPPSPAGPTPCDLENAALQRGLDGAHAKTTEAVLAVRNAACGGGTFYDAAQQKDLLTTVPTDAANLDYGLGIMVFGAAITAGAGTGIGHGGDIPGYHTQAFYFPATKTTLVAIVDSDADNPNDVSLAALKVLFK